MRGTQFAELNAFVAVAERSNFAKAAAHLGLNPSTISQIIRTLEERLGVRLFNRTTRSVSLTEAGERLFTRVRPAIAEIGAAVQDLNDFRNAAAGTLRLQATTTSARIVLEPVIKAFLEAYPAISLDLTVDDRLRDIVTGHFDAGIRTGRLISQDMQIVRVSEPSRLIAFAAPDYLRRNGRPESLADLEQHNCIRLRADEQITPWTFADSQKDIEVYVKGSLIVNSIGLMIQSVLDGIGIGYTIESAVTSLIKETKIVPLLTDWSIDQESYYLYYPGRRRVPVALKMFIAFLRQSRGTTPM
jgi:DNA-binding transcriptional LysR family regulator